VSASTADCTSISPRERTFEEKKKEKEKEKRGEERDLAGAAWPSQPFFLFSSLLWS
jgi:hypothetical protein